MAHGEKKQFNRRSSRLRLERIVFELHEIKEKAEAAGRSLFDDAFLQALVNGGAELERAMTVLSRELDHRKALRKQLEEA